LTQAQNVVPAPSVLVQNHLLVTTGQQANSTVTVSDITQDHRLTAAAAQVVSQSRPMT
jgi:hypothetical protein